MYMYMYMYVYMYVYLHMHVFMYVYAYVYYVYIHVHMYTHTYTHIYEHLYTSTHSARILHKTVRVVADVGLPPAWSLLKTSKARSQQLGKGAEVNHDFLNRVLFCCLLLLGGGGMFRSPLG